MTNIKCPQISSGKHSSCNNAQQANWGYQSCSLVRVLPAVGPPHPKRKDFLIELLVLLGTRGCLFC